MECARGILSFLTNNNNNKRLMKEKEKSFSFLQNGSMLLEGLLASCNGRYNIPIHSFSAKDLIRATNNFDNDHAIFNRGWYGMYWGSLEERRILIKKFDGYGSSDALARPYAVRDIVVTAQMSNHKNVLKLIGCCLEFSAPALVYEYAGNERLSNLLFDMEEGNIGHADDLLSWKNRLRIVNEIANAVVYLHTAFTRTVIHRNLKPSNVIIDQCGVAKLIDFAFSISLPLGESEVEDRVTGTPGFVDPEYQQTGFVTVKSDVYSFGMFLLELFTGQSAVENRHHLHDCVKHYLEKVELNEIMDPRILGEGGGIEQEQQLRAFAALALKCLQDKGEDRPEMIDVAKELRRIEKSVHPG